MDQSELIAMLLLMLFGLFTAIMSVVIFHRLMLIDEKLKLFLHWVQGEADYVRQELQADIEEFKSEKMKVS